MNRRRAALSIYDPVYDKKGDYGDPCTYCGQVSDTLDHVPPLNMVYIKAEVGLECEGPFVKVPACSECNMLLGKVHKVSIKERRAHIKDAIKKKYKRFLKIPNWDEDELEDVDPAFARDIRASVHFANHVRARLRWMR